MLSKYCQAIRQVCLQAFPTQGTPKKGLRCAENPDQPIFWVLQILLLVCIGLGAAPLLWKISGTPFLPLQSWAQSSATWQVLGGIGLAALYLITLAISWPCGQPTLPKRSIVAALFCRPDCRLLVGAVRSFGGWPADRGVGRGPPRGAALPRGAR